MAATVLRAAFFSSQKANLSAAHFDRKGRLAGEIACPTTF
jgi:hypothetical protein